MIGAKTTDATCIEYELEIAIEAPPEKVWKALIEETNFWWLPDFHMVAPNSQVTFDPQPGGKGLIEQIEGGGGLQWYTVQYYLPAEFKIYLVGYIAPDYGGPSTSHMKIAVVETDRGCLLQVTDAHHGASTEAAAKSLHDGWTQLFSAGLKAFVENGTRQDQTA